LTRAIVILLWFLALALPGFAQETGPSCAAIPGDAERLACYDAIFRGGEDGPAAVEVRIESQQLIPARPVGRAPAAMVIACDADGLAVRFSFADQVLSNTSDNAPVTFQIDLGGNTVRNLPVDDANTSVGFPTARDAGAFLDTLDGARSLKVRITPVRQRSLTVDFVVRDHAADIAALRETCGSP
jgi:type VI secretion system protein VasI